MMQGTKKKEGKVSVKKRTKRLRRERGVERTEEEDIKENGKEA